MLSLDLATDIAEHAWTERAECRGRSGEDAGTGGAVGTAEREFTPILMSCAIARPPVHSGRSFPKNRGERALQVEPLQQRLQHAQLSDGSLGAQYWNCLLPIPYH